MPQHQGPGHLTLTVTDRTPIGFFVPGQQNAVESRIPPGNEIELYIDVQPEVWRDDPAAVLTPIKPLHL